MTNPEPVTPSTATELLRQQHAKARQLIDELSSASDRRRDLFDELRELLAIHETAEEMIVHPVARGEAGGEFVVDARLDEEGELKVMLAELEDLGVDDGAFPSRLVEFRTRLLAHAEAEEESEFPILDAHVDQERLRQMAESVLVAEGAAPSHAHRHAPESAIGNIVIGPFVALVDSIRDRLREHERERNS